MSQVKIIPNLINYGIAKTLMDSFIHNRNLYIVLSTMRDLSKLNPNLVWYDINWYSGFAVNLKGDSPNDKMSIMYASSSFDYDIKYVDSGSNVVYLKIVDPTDIATLNSLSGETAFWLYIKKVVKWSLIPSGIIVNSTHNSQHLVMMESYTSDSVKMPLSAFGNGVVLSSLYDDNILKKFNNSTSIEFAIFEHFIKIENSFACS